VSDFYYFKGPAVLLEAVREDLRLLTWSEDSFAYADSIDDDAGRYRGLRCGQVVNISEDNLSGLLVRPGVALKQHQAETAPAAGGFAEPIGGFDGGVVEPVPTGGISGATGENGMRRPKRFHGSISLDPARVGRDAGRIQEIAEFRVRLLKNGYEVLPCFLKAGPRVRSTKNGCAARP
jgi:hypothetical protein